MKFLSKLYKGGGGMDGFLKGVIGAITTIIVIILLDTEVVPVLINGSDGGIGQTVLPIIQAALLVAAILAAIGILYVSAKHSFGSSK